ncbi:carboxypeptidase regulatory-like domain-containing protein [Spirosoma endbachense]|uniref:OmpA family protein n=1 Tax=Spirosoma endbachense TaxID=2666025 RepID=A0A6P1W4Y3_9BACT|nr:carboxypeptidase regulatory-like domain-containing protein [Spirosoma endbachense]QHW00512.1 OmpA family protein [Spirosoma endbachense]
MRTSWVKLILGVLLWLGCSTTAWSQADSLLRQAERLLSYKAYGRAIDAYTQILSEQGDQLTTAQKATAQGKLAYAYQQVGDGVKAERYYREALTNGTDEDPQQLLQFAQTLASNGKYQESQKQYERYLQLRENTPSRRPSVTPDGDVPISGGRKEAIRYRLEYLALNSAGEEFSPAFYQEGLVYVSGKKGGSAIETKGNGGGAGYLDLFYVPNRNSLKIASIINADGSTSKPVNERIKNERQVGSDEYTRPTANDSRTVPGFDASINITEGLGYDVRSTSSGQRFSKTINTKYHEGPATFSKDGSRIIFTRNNYNEGRSGKSDEGVNKLKLYTARQQNGIWIDVEELPFNSDEYSVGHPTLSRDEQFLYFASDMPGGFGGTDIYVSRFLNGQWGRPVNLGQTVNTKGNELFPFVDDAGNLYFSSDGRGGLGALDVFFATLANPSTVQSVEHLDAPINSAEDDFGLITDAGRRGGYFSSSRRDGNDNIYRFVRESSLFGCRDLTIRLYDTNTDAPLDSVTVLVKAKGEGRPDQTITTDRNGLVRICLEGNNNFTFQASRDGYINSTIGFTTRALTDDQPTRLEISMMKPTVIMDTIPDASAGPVSLTRSRITGIVISERDRRPIEGVTVRLRNECDRTQLEYVTGSDGRYSFDLDPGCDYTLVASKPEFGTNTNRIKRLPKKAKPKELSADLRMLSVGDVVTIDNIYYDLDRYSLRPDAARELDRLVATMRKYPSLVIEIRSHTDSRGDAGHNKILSTERAKAVANYLNSRGISRKRMVAIGMGESQLVNNCTDGVICTDAEHQRNRRTEFKVVSIK